jgi:hypothetical protein
MSRPKIKKAVLALLLAVSCCLPCRLFAQDTGGMYWGGLGGLSRWDAIPLGATALPESAPRPRRWTLHFPSDWRYPAIVHPPVKVYLDPPYEVEDPFGRIPPAAPPVADDPAPAPPAIVAPRPIPRPKVLELNPDTGLLEERSLRPIQPLRKAESTAKPAPSPPDDAPSPFRDLRRWDGHG